MTKKDITYYQVGIEEIVKNLIQVMEIVFEFSFDLDFKNIKEVNAILFSVEGMVSTEGIEIKDGFKENKKDLVVLMLFVSSMLYKYEESQEILVQVSRFGELDELLSNVSKRAPVHTSSLIPPVVEDIVKAISEAIIEADKNSSNDWDVNEDIKALKGMIDILENNRKIPEDIVKNLRKVSGVLKDFSGN